MTRFERITTLGILTSFSFIEMNLVNISGTQNSAVVVVVKTSASRDARSSTLSESRFG